MSITSTDLKLTISVESKSDKNLKEREKAIRNIEDVKKEIEKEVTEEIKGDFCDFSCPITCEIMQEPMIAADGHSYEKKAIEEWFQKHNTNLLKNHALKKVIEAKVNETIKEKIQLYQKQAEDGTAEAQFCLGLCYEAGLGLKRDSQKAVEWFRKAAEQGDSRAQYKFGRCFDYGIGITQNAYEATGWYRRAAEQGDAQAQNDLAVCYKQGIGVVQDTKAAVEWYRRAAEQGNAIAQHNLGLCYEKGVGVAQDTKAAVEWYRRAAEQGNAPAQFNLGFCYHQGIGVVQHTKAAVEWYRRAAEQGNAPAQSNLGFCYERGIEVVQDIKAAAEWYRRAAEQGNAQAQCNLGLCYEKGLGVAQDTREKVKWYRRAAEQGNAQAQYNLGACYEHGSGVVKDAKIAMEWYQRSADLGNDEAKTRLNELNKKLNEFTQSLDVLASEMTKLTGKYLNDTELETCSKIMPNFLVACKSDIEERKRVREELLPHVFNANPQGIEDFFKSAADVSPKLLLTKASYREGYNSKELSEFICFRHWQGASPLQAAFLCGDIFIGRKLLAYIFAKNEQLTPEVDLLRLERLRLEAVQQLNEIMNRTGIKTTIDNVNVGNMEAGASAAASTAAGAAANGRIMDCKYSNTKENKEDADTKESVDNTEAAFADSSEFLAPIKDLIRAYNIYIKQYPLYPMCAPESLWNKIDKLWGQIAECQKRLPHYVKQEFFSPIPFEPLPKFNTEPSREVCHYQNNDLLDLDKVGSNRYGLYKSVGHVCRAARALDSDMLRCVGVGFTTFTHLYELRQADLRNTINDLQTLESALTFSGNTKISRMKC